MPLRRRRYARRRSFKRTKKYATKKYVKHLIHKDHELKNWDVVNNGTVTTAGTIISILDPIQGTTQMDRIGDKITIRGMQFRYEVAVADAWNNMRVIVVQWYPNTSMLAPTVANILASTGSTSSFLTPYNRDYEDQYHILYDKLIVVDTNRPARSVMKRSINIKFAKRTVEFIGNTVGAVTGSNKLYLVVISDSSGTTHPLFTYYTRIMYDDA